MLAKELIKIGVTMARTGEHLFTVPGTYSWVCPQGVTSVSAVCIGGGGGGNQNGIYMNQVKGGGGGGLGWRNAISVTPGQAYTVVVGGGGAKSSKGAPGGDSYFINKVTVAGLGGTSFTVGGAFVGNGGGNGGSGVEQGGAGGAGGYTGNGGNGVKGAGNFNVGAGGAGASGSGGSPSNSSGSTSGGGTLPFGIGASGSVAGGQGSTVNGNGTTISGYYGAGGRGSNSTSLVEPGIAGCVRLVWGDGRAFPGTYVGQSYSEEIYNN